MLYGSMTARIKMPAGQGIWPAFWELGSNYPVVGWPASGEIDVIELINNGETYYVTLHGPQGATDYYAGSGGSWGPAARFRPPPPARSKT